MNDFENKHSSTYFVNYLCECPKYLKYNKYITTKHVAVIKQLA